MSYLSPFMLNRMAGYIAGETFTVSMHTGEPGNDGTANRAHANDGSSNLEFNLAAANLAADNAETDNTNAVVVLASPSAAAAEPRGRKHERNGCAACWGVGPRMRHMRLGGPAGTLDRSCPQGVRAPPSIRRARLRQARRRHRAAPRGPSAPAGPQARLPCLRQHRGEVPPRAQAAQGPVLLAGAADARQARVRELRARAVSDSLFYTHQDDQIASQIRDDASALFVFSAVLLFDVGMEMALSHVKTRCDPEDMAKDRRQG